MKTQQEIEKDAAAIIMGQETWDVDERVRALSAAGLLATPTLNAVWEAAKELAKPFNASGYGALVVAVQAHAATLVKPERYEAARNTFKDDCWCVGRRGPGQTWNQSADFYGPDAERHAREHAAKLNSETR